MTIHTDHLNLLYNKCPAQRMIWWRLMLEEFHPKVFYVAGTENYAADALSRLDMANNPRSDEQEWETPLPPLTYQDEVRERIQLLFPLAAEKELKPTTEFLLVPELIKYYQQRDKTSRNTTSTSVTVKAIEGEDLIHQNGKFYIPSALRQRVLDWYHTMLLLPGETRMERIIKSVYTWKGMKKDIQKYCKHCKTCQLFKKTGRKKYGMFPAKTPVKPPIGKE